MNIYQLAAEEMRKRADHFKLQLDLAAEFERIGDLEQAVQAKQAKLKFIEDKVAAEERRLSAAAADANDASNKAAKIVIDAKVEAELRLAAAAKEADMVAVDAYAKADKIVSEAAAKKASFEVDCGRLRAEAATLTAEVNAKGAALAALKAELDSLKKKLG